MRTTLVYVCMFALRLILWLLHVSLLTSLTHRASIESIRPSYIKSINVYVLYNYVTVVLSVPFYVSPLYFTFLCTYVFVACTSGS